MSTLIRQFEKAGMTTGVMTKAVLLALLPSFVSGVFTYGEKTLFLLAAVVLSACGTELIAELILRRHVTLQDGSAILSAFIITMMMSPNIPYLYAAAAAAGAMLLKALCGGLGKNVINPALSAIIGLHLFAPRMMQDFSGGLYGETATLRLLNSADSAVQIGDLLLGRQAGPIGTCCGAALLAGVVLLVAFGVTDGIAGTAATLAYALTFILFSGYGFYPQMLAGNLLAGSFLFAVFVMASDPVTSPIRTIGRIIYGILLGVLIFAFRMTPLAEAAVVPALFICNLFVKPIDRITARKSRAYNTYRSMHKTIQTRREIDNADSL